MNDLISRRAAIKAIDDLPNCYNGYSDTYDKAYIIGVLEELPTIDPVKHGKWIPVDEKNDAFDCSECDAMVLRRYNYCPNCGARMDDDDDGKCVLIAGCDYDDTNGTQRRKDCPLIELPDAEREIDKWWERNETVNVMAKLRAYESGKRSAEPKRGNYGTKP